MKYKCCKVAINTLIFNHNCLSLCFFRLGTDYVIRNNYNGETDFIEDYKNARNNFILDCKRGNELPNICYACPFFISYEWEDTIGLDCIVVANRTKCSCNCIYCHVTKGNENERKKLNHKKVWNIKPVLKELEKNNLLKEKGKLFIAGGECSEYPASELRWLIKYALKNNFSLKFVSSGMFYSKEIEKTLQKNEAILVISVDSGSKKMYEKIKRVPYYDIVWNNIKKYIKAAENNNQATVSVKYIILNGINDSLEEFKIFLQKCYEAKCTHIEVTMEEFWLTSVQGIKGIKSKTSEGAVEILRYIEALNDKRIHTDFIKKVTKKRTSARVYSSEIEESIRNGNIILNIPTFAAKEETYRKLTNTNMFEEIWNNIKKYSDLIKLKPENSCNIVIQYKILLGINDSIDELNELIEKCNQLDISSIEFNISDSHINNDFTKDKIESLQNSITHIKAIKNMNITFDSKLTDIINNI